MPTEEVTRELRERRRSAGGRRCRASSRSTCRAHVARAPARRRSSTRSPTSRAAGCTATSSRTPPSCAPSSRTATACPTRVVVGNGAAQLLGVGGARAASSRGDELVTPWPSLSAATRCWRGARAAHAVPVAPASASRRSSRGQRPHPRSSRCATRTTRPASCSPRRRCGALLAALPERVVVLLDEALRGLVDAAVDAALGLLEDFPRLLVLPLVLEGLGPGGPARRLRASAARLASRCSSSSRPSWASTSSRRRARWRRCARPSASCARRVERVRERARATAAASCARATGHGRRRAQANFVWLEAAGMDGAELTRRLDRASVRVAERRRRWATQSASASRSRTPQPAIASCAPSTARSASSA